MPIVVIKRRIQEISRSLEGKQMRAHACSDGTATPARYGDICMFQAGCAFLTFEYGNLECMNLQRIGLKSDCRW